jgi:predicted phage-related endonuclease
MGLTPEQKTAREGTIGSSDAPVVAGLSPYKSPLVLYHELRGDLERYSDQETQAQRIGSKLEPVIAEIAADELGLKIRRCAPRRSLAHPFMSANVDFEIVSHAKGPGVFEIKNRSGLAPWEQLPDDIEIQTRHQLAVTNRSWGLVAAMFQFGTIRTYEVARDQEIEAYLIELEGRFMLRVERGEPPDTVWTEDSLSLLKRLYPQDSGKTVTLDNPRALTEVMQLMAAKDMLKSTEAAKDAAEGWLKAQMEDASTAIIPGYGELTWRTTKSSTHFDEEAFKAAHPALYQQFIKERPGYRRFLLKPAKEAT